jgi:hypothetical protein
LYAHTRRRLVEFEAGGKTMPLSACGGAAFRGQATTGSGPEAREHEEEMEMMMAGEIPHGPSISCLAGTEEVRRTRQE